MYNASTVFTLGLAVTLLYLVLFVGIFLAAVVVIASSYLRLTLGTDVSVWSYLDIAWLSASMGTAAGALGSNFDDEDDIRNLTHGRRRAQRYKVRDQTR